MRSLTVGDEAAELEKFVMTDDAAAQESQWSRAVWLCLRCCLITVVLAELFVQLAAREQLLQVSTLTATANAMAELSSQADPFLAPSFASRALLPVCSTPSDMSQGMWYRRGPVVTGDDYSSLEAGRVPDRDDPPDSNLTYAPYSCHFNDSLQDEDGAALCSAFLARGLSFIMYVGDSLMINSVLHQRLHLWHDRRQPTLNLTTCWLGRADGGAFTDCMDGFYCDDRVRISTVHINHHVDADMLLRWLANLHYWPVQWTDYEQEALLPRQRWELHRLKALKAAGNGTLASLSPDAVLFGLGVHELTPPWDNKPALAAAAIRDVTANLLYFSAYGVFPLDVMQRIRKATDWRSPAARQPAQELHVDDIVAVQKRSRAPAFRVAYLGPSAPSDIPKGTFRDTQSAQQCDRLHQHTAHVMRALHVPYFDMFRMTNMVARQQSTDGTHFSATVNVHKALMCLHWLLYAHHQ